jgi:mono/diheme cytochrome c family protein
MIGLRRTTIALFTLLFAAGCEDNMRDQARIKPFEESPFFSDGRSARPLPPGTIARGQLPKNVESTRMPVAVTRELLQRGRERYAIFCTVCHGADGNGKGIVVERGFSPPPSYHDERLRSADDGYLFDVITNGKGAMYPYASRVPTEDRWAIVAYIRALQLSQHSKLEDVPESERTKLREMPHE